jgi:tRNA/rRNA methyltransferase
MILPILVCFLGVIRTRFILTQTRHAGNVGAAARAMKTMGFDELVLVSPRDPKVLNRQRTKEGASGAVNVLQGAYVCDSLAEALEGIDIWCATGMPNDMSRSRETQRFSAPRPFLEDLIQKDDGVKSIAFVFGNEKLGMTKEDIDLCHVVLGIPTNPKFGSLNLASAVQLVDYDLRQALGGYTIE